MNIGMLSNWRRANVAFTRARKKLIVTGSVKDLQKIETMDKFIKYFQEKNYIINITNEML